MRAHVCVCFAMSRHRDSFILLISSARLGACACECVWVRVHVCLCVCIKRVPGCSPIHSDIIDQRPKTDVFADFGKRLMDGQPEGQPDEQTDRHFYRDGWTRIKMELNGKGWRRVGNMNKAIEKPCVTRHSVREWPYN